MSPQIGFAAVIVGGLSAIDVVHGATHTTAPVLLGFVAVVLWAVLAWTCIAPAHAGRTPATIALPVVEMAIIGLLIWRLPTLAISLLPTDPEMRLMQLTGRFDATVLSFQMMVCWLLWRYAVSPGQSTRSMVIEPVRRFRNQRSSYAAWGSHMVLMLLIGTYLFRHEWGFGLFYDLEREAVSLAASAGLVPGMAVAGLMLGAATVLGLTSRRPSRRLWLAGHATRGFIRLLLVAILASVIGIALVAFVEARATLISLRATLWQLQILAAIALLVTDARRSEHRIRAAELDRLSAQASADQAAASSAAHERERIEAARLQAAGRVDPLQLAAELAKVEADLQHDRAVAQVRLDKVIHELRARMVG